MERAVRAVRSNKVFSGILTTLPRGELSRSTGVSRKWSSWPFLAVPALAEALVEAEVEADVLVEAEVEAEGGGRKRR